MIINNSYTNSIVKNKENSSLKRVSCKGKADIIDNLAGESWIAKFSYKFAKAGGEKVANMVNAGGKMAIAPLIIALNPFSKEEKETKVYSACKHPIEAVLTIAIQILALNKVGKYIDNLSMQGKLAKNFNLKDVPNGPELDLISKRLGVFKDRVGIGVALAAIPVVTSITNWAYPKIMKKIMPKKNDNVEASYRK